MINFVCPVCRRELRDADAAYCCSAGHNFDKSKFGYVNLLQSQKSSAKRHGDDRLMVRARRDFLEKGYYGFLLDELCAVCERYLPDFACVLDAGCGECYYSSELKKRLAYKKLDFAGIDISKNALEYASKRKSGIPAAVASLFSLPLADSSCDAVLNVFSPEANGEFLRVLKNGGILIRVIPLERHLWGLKSVIYEKPYENNVPCADCEGFKLLESRAIRRETELESNEDIMNLFKMTPYYYKTGKEDQQKIASLCSLKTQLEFEIRVYAAVKSAERKDDNNE